MYILIALLVLSSVSAADFSVSIFPNQRSVKTDEAAEFEIELQHDGPFEELFEVYSTDVVWDIRTEAPLRVLPDIPLKAKLFVRPLNINPGLYSIALNFRKAGTNEVLKELIQVEVVSPFPPDAEYLPAIRGSVQVPPQVDPRQGLTLKLSLENQNKRILQRVDVKLRSAVVNKDYTTSLGPLEKKTLTFIADIDPRTPPQKDILYITLLVPEQEKAYQFDLLPVSYDVVPYGGVVPSVSAERAFLKTVETVTLKNEGNKIITHVYRVRAIFTKPLISGNPKPVSEGIELVWEVPLEPGESRDLVITYNYRPLFWLLLLTVIGLIVYFKYRSPIVVRKNATVLSTEEGGISELKVVIEFVNRSNKTVRHLRIMDLVPRLADVIKEFKETILAPSKVVPHSNRGTLVRWDIDFVEPKEHRILTYKVRSKLSILGGLKLPVAAVRFSAEGKEREAVSNQPEIKFRSQDF